MLWRRRAGSTWLVLIFLVLAAVSVLDGLLRAMEPSAPHPVTLAMWPTVLRQHWYRLIFHNTFATFYLVCALAAPFVLELTRRLPLRREAWARPLLVHLLVSTLFVLPWFIGKYGFQSFQDKGEQFLALVMAPVSLARLTLWCAPTYFLVVLYGHILHYQEAAQRHALQASELERSLVEAQLQALRMKLQPHFLYNTLNTIQFLALARDTEAISQVVDRLGRLLRYSMDASGRPFVSLEEELAAVDLTLGIEELRFRDRLRVVRHVAPEVLGVPVPNLILQPLVENALKHGFSKRLAASLLEIRAWREGDRLKVAIQDDGPGPAPGWELATGCGRGLKHVLERLELLYPGDHAFSLAPLDGPGALALLDLPLHPPSPRGAAHGADQDRHRG